MSEDRKLVHEQRETPAPALPGAAGGRERARSRTTPFEGNTMGEPGDTQGLRDALTGAYSRATLHDRLRHEVERARRYGLPLSILVIDLDHFKSVNDAFGHTRGDRVLTDFVDRTQSLTRDSDLLFRYGGDEFVLLLLHTDSQQALGFARRLLEGVQAQPFAGTPPLSVTLSVGSASFPGDGQTAEDLFERADSRLYEAKRQGRARVVAEDHTPAGPMTFETDARLLERELALSALRQFLDSLPDHKRGVFTISGPRGVGKTGFLAEVAKSARLRGYAVWSLQGRASMRNRLYGALAEATPPASQLPPPAAGEAQFIQALQRSLVEQGQAGLLVVVDRPADLDAATLDLLRQLLFAPDLSVVAVAHTADAAGLRRPALLEASLRGQVELEALTPHGVRLWVRSALRWEPPAAFSDWLHGETQGLPGRLSQALHYLLDKDLLRPGPDTWVVEPGLQNLRLGEALEQRGGAPPHNLPAAPTAFVGRHAELQEIKRLLRQAQVVALTGPGGIGKTRLAVQAAAELGEQFADGLYFVALDGAATVSSVVSATAHALGLSFAASDEASTQLLRYVRDRSVLLIWDDTGSVLAADDLLAVLAAQAPGVKVLLTARERPGLAGALVLELRGLPVPPVVGARASAPASHYSAEQLFVQCAQRAAPDYALSDEDRLYVRRICQLVEGMPLGIELAAAWTPIFKAREIAAQLESSLELLAGSGSEVPPGQRSALALLGYFWGLLAEDEGRRLRWLSLFRGGFEQEAARQVAGASLFFISALVDKAFLRRGAAGRYVMHELMRQYAENRLHADPVEWQQATSVHCDYYAGLLQRHLAPLKGAAQAAALANLRLEIGNIRAAWHWAALHGHAAAIGQGFETLVLFYASEQWFEEGAHLFERALENWRAQHAPAPADATLAQLAAGYGVFLHRLGQNVAAQAALNESLAHARAQPTSGAQPGQLAFTLYYLGLVLIDLGDYLPAQAVLRESLGLYRGADDQHGMALALDHLAALANELGDYPEARRLYQESLALRRAAGDQHGVVLSLGSLGDVAIDLGNYREAEDALGESSALAKSLALPWGQANSQRSLGWLALTRGELQRARECFAASLAYSRSTAQPKAIGQDELGLANVAFLAGDFAEARRRYEAALRLFQDTGFQRGQAMALTGLGETALAADPAAALPPLREALLTALRIGALPWVLAAVAGLAPLWVRAGQANTAVALLTLVLYHPASNRRTQNQAARLLSRLEGELPAAQVASAEDDGRRLARDAHTVLTMAREYLDGLTPAE